MTSDQITQFIDSYLEAVNFTNDEGLFDHSEEFLLNVNRDCVKFLQMISDANLFEYIADYIPQAGQDFWLTRNRHGAGFWDREELYGEEAAELLTEISHQFKECEVYVGDDNLVYC